MRLYSIHPKYLDQKGLCGLWAEANLAQSVLLKGEYTECPKCIRKGYFIGHIIDCLKCKGTGKIKTPYWNHPALKCFKECERPLDAIGRYLLEIYAEAEVRGYNFDSSKIKGKLSPIKLTVTTGQLNYEFEHLQNKLDKRCPDTWLNNYTTIRKIDMFVKPHPLFKVIEGNIESWKKIK